MNENEKNKKIAFSEHEIIQIDDCADDELAMKLQMEEIEESERQHQPSQNKSKVSCSSDISEGDIFEIKNPQVYNVDSEVDSNVIMDDIVEIPLSPRPLILSSRKVFSNDSSNDRTAQLIINQSKIFQEGNGSSIRHQREFVDAQLAALLQFEEDHKLTKYQKQQYAYNDLSKPTSSSINSVVSSNFKEIPGYQNPFRRNLSSTSSSSTSNELWRQNGYYYDNYNDRIVDSSSRTASSSDFPLGTYEELSGLEEIIGVVHIGAKSQEEIDFQSCKYVVMNNNKNQTNQLDEGGGACIICLCDLEIGQHARTLQCFHSFHQKCIDEWLYQKKECPVCKHKLN